MTQQLLTLPILNLDHPGAADRQYQKRRKEIAEQSLAFHSSELKDPPKIHYTPEEHGLWRLICGNLQPLQMLWASSWYLQGRKKLPISEEEIPQLRELSKALEKACGFRLEPIHGLVEPAIFLKKLGEGVMLCTQYIRHPSRPEFTPEPDVVHEILGHVPMFLQPEIREFSLRLGKAAARASEEQMKKLINLYWFTLEYGLLLEKEELKAFGAGLLGGMWDLTNTMTGKVRLRPFSLAEILTREINYSSLQEELFVLPSFQVLIEETEGLLAERAGEYLCHH